MPTHRHLWSAAAAALLLIPLASAALSAGGPPALAARVAAPDHSARGPSAAADKFGNQYIFWRNKHGQLSEGAYDTYTRRWLGPTVLKMGQLGSEPSVTTAPDQIYYRDGGKRPFAWVYVFWTSASAAHDLMMAYYNGASWHGAINLGKQGAFQPSATDDTYMGADKMEVFWRGSDGRLWQISSGDQPWRSSTYSRPVQATFGGHSFGTLGSSPASGGDACDGTRGLCSYANAVVWQGTDGELWGSNYSISKGGWTSGPQQVLTGPQHQPYRAKLGSAPTVVTEGDGSTDTAWQGTGSSRPLMELSGGAVVRVGYGPLGSVPAVAWSKADSSPLTSNQLFIYWTSFSGFLNEAHYEASGWHHTVVSKFGDILNA
jgi:hypothetical protein